MTDEIDTTTIRTKVAAEMGSDHWFCGYRIIADLVGNDTATGLLGLAIGKRRLSEAEVAVLDELAALILVADPRVWPLKLARIIASYGRVLPAIAAGNLILEGAIVGPWNCGAAAQFIVGAREVLDQAGDVEAAVDQALSGYVRSFERIAGFGVPLRDTDERLEAFSTCMHENGRDQLPYWRTMRRIVPVLRSVRGLEPNFGAGVAASLLDMGYAADEISVLAWMMQLLAYVPNAMEAAEQTLPLFRSFPAQYVEFIGRPARQSPKKATSDR